MTEARRRTRVPWDEDTERQVDEAIALVNAAPRPRPPLRIVDHHPWEPPDVGPSARFPWNVSDVRRLVAGAVASAIVIDVVVRASHHDGWLRIVLIVVAMLVSGAALVTDRWLR